MKNSVAMKSSVPTLDVFAIGKSDGYIVIVCPSTRWGAGGGGPTGGTRSQSTTVIVLAFLPASAAMPVRV